MDEVLANAVLQRQSYYVGEFMNKIIALEAKLMIVESQLAELSAKYEKEQQKKGVKPA